MIEQSDILNSGVVILDLQKEDMPDLMPIMRHWIRNGSEVLEDEVEETVAVIRESLSEASWNHYLVAKDENGKVLGFMGYGTVNPRMKMFRSSADTCSAGLLTAFLSPNARGKGVGRLLLSSLFDKAGISGAAEMIWSSNPRYRDTAWKFYTSMAGDPAGTINDLFYKGSISPVWKKILSRTDSVNTK